MNDFGKVFFVILLATVINVIARIRQKKEPTSILVSGAILAAIMLTTAELWRYDIVYVMALLFLVSSLVINGQPFLQGMSQFLGGIKR
jgi:hypothetical protein